MKDTNHTTTTVQTEQLKQSLVERFTREYAELGARLVYQAVTEAHALASLTFVPYLVLPSLAEEKVQQVAAWAAHQRMVRHAEQLALAA